MPLALIGFDAGILEDARHPLWDYRADDNASADRDKKPVDPTIWLKDSVVWYSQRLTRQLGAEKFQAYIHKLNYGNEDLSGNPGKSDGLTQSWLMSSLKISPDEQVRFVRRFLTRDLPVSEPVYTKTIESLPVFAADGGWTVRGKTGSGGQRDGSRALPGWFVGWAEKDKRQVAFARLELRNDWGDGYGGPTVRTEMLSELKDLIASAK